MNIKNLSVESPFSSGNTLSEASKYFMTEKPILYRDKITIKHWRDALNRAEQNLSIFYPLVRIYKEIELEADAVSIKDIRKNNVLSRPISLKDKNGNETDQLNKWWEENKWKQNFISDSLDSIFFGYSCLKIGDIKNDIISEIESIKREYFNPKKDILLKNYSDTTGKLITEEDTNDWIFKVSPYSHNEDYLGLWAKAAPYVINSRMSLNMWSDLLRRTGTGQLIIKSDLTNEEEKIQMREFAKNIESSYFSVIPTDSSIEFLSSNGQGEVAFANFVDLQRKNVTKLVLGSDIANTQQAFVGSAQIAAAQSNLYAQNDIIFIERVFNDILFPRLVNLGIKFLDGAKIEIEKTSLLDLGAEYGIIKDLILSGQYEVPDEYLQKKFGIPLTKIITDPNRI